MHIYEVFFFFDWSVKLQLNLYWNRNLVLIRGLTILVFYGWGTMTVLFSSINEENDSH